MEPIKEMSENGQSNTGREFPGKLALNIEEKLEKLRGQYEEQLDTLRSEMGPRRPGPKGGDKEGGEAKDEAGDTNIQAQLRQVREELKEGVAGEQKDRLESLLTDIDQKYQEQISELHQQHLENVGDQVKAMRVTLEEIYASQLELIRSELETSHQGALSDLRESLTKEHKDDVNRLEQEFNTKMEELKLDYDRELQQSKLEESLGEHASADFMSKLNQKLSQEHQEILEKIQKDLEAESVSRGRLPRRQHTSKDAQTDFADDTESVKSAPVTEGEFKHLEERQAILEKSADVRTTLESQYEDIAALRSRMLAEYEQLLSTRTEVMASQTQEVDKLQQEMTTIQNQYEEQMKIFQAKVEAQAESAVKSRLVEEHSRELDDLKQYYETKVQEMEKSYSTDMSQLKMDHSKQLEALKEDLDTPSDTSSAMEKEREYIKKTTMLTAISDTEETPPSSPRSDRPSDSQQAELRSLEEKLKERENLLNELKKRLEAEAASAEDLHGKLLDSNKTLLEYEDSLKAKAEEIEELKAALKEKDSNISALESEKAAREEHGEKGDGEGGSASQKKIVEELQMKLKKLEEELSASRLAEHSIQQELNQLNSQHQDAIMALKTEMDAINASRLESLEAAHKEQIAQELERQASELEKKYEEELKEKTDSISGVYEKQLDEMKEKLDSSAKQTESSEAQQGAVTVTVKVPEGEEKQEKEKETDMDRDQLEALIRENVRVELLQEYEQSIDTLKGEYEERISSLNSRLQNYEAQGSDQQTVVSVKDSESGASEQELQVRETMRAELAQEYKDRLHSVTEEYESRLKQLQDLVDSRESGSPPDSIDSRDSEMPLSPTSKEAKVKLTGKQAPDYEGYVATLRSEYEGKIKDLQSEIAQYKSNLEPVPSTVSKSEEAPGVTVVTVATPDEGVLLDVGKEVPVEQGKAVSVETKVTAEAEVTQKQDQTRDEIKEEVEKEFESVIANMKSDYETKLKEVSEKLSALQTEGSQLDQKETDLSAGKEEDISKLKAEYEAKISELEQELQKAKNEKTAAEQKVKADMFKWHEETVSQLKRGHEQTITQLRKEYEEKMDLLRDELQEEFEAEKVSIHRSHRRELADAEERYENLVEGLRTGDVPELASLVQEKFDMELEMAKTLIQQECDETIEAEQARITEQHNETIERLLNEKDEALQEAAGIHEKELADLRNSLLQQYESQVLEMESYHVSTMQAAQAEFQVLLERAKAGITSPEMSRLEEEEKADKPKPDDTQEALEPEVSAEATQKTEAEQQLEPVLELQIQAQVRDTATTRVTALAEGTSSKPDDSRQQEAPTETPKEQEKEQKIELMSEAPVQPQVNEVVMEATWVGTPVEGSEPSQPEVREEVIKAQRAVPRPEGRPTEPSAERMGDGDGKETDELATQADLIRQLRQQLAEKEAELASKLKEMEALCEAEVSRLKQALLDKDTEHGSHVKDMEEKHQQEMSVFQERIQSLQQGMQRRGSDEGVPEDTEALELAHQQELQDLEDRLTQKHRNDLDNLDVQHQARLDSMTDKHKTEIESLQQALSQAEQNLLVFPGRTMSPEMSAEAQTVPEFHGTGPDMGSSLESRGSLDFMVPSRSTPKDFPEEEREPQKPMDQIMETQLFDVRSMEEESSSPKGSPPGTLGPQGTLEQEGILSLEASMEQSPRDSPRGSLRGVDDTQTSTDLLHFSEEDSDKSLEEGDLTQKTDTASTPLLQTLAFGSVVSGGPTVKSLDDTSDASERVFERDELYSRVKELEAEVDDLRRKLAKEAVKQGDQMDRLEREKQEDNNLVSMLRGDIERLNGDRENLQSTNEHLLGLLSDTVKTYMNVEENISKKLKTMMERPQAAADKPRPGSGERKRTPPRRSPTSSSPKERLSPAAEHGGADGQDGENIQETSVLSNDEGLDLSQRISDSIFQGPELASDEEEMLADSGRRLQTSVARLLDMIEETTSQLLDTKQTQGDLMETLDVQGQKEELLAARAKDVEERLQDEVQRKDFLALELHKAEGLIEGYSSERESLEQKVRELEEQKEMLALELETTKNKLLDMMETHTENQSLKKEMHEQQALIQDNVGEEAQVATATESEATSGGEALMLEVTRLNSENREKEQQMKQVQDRYESRVRELETSGEDMESMYMKLLDEKKQELQDLRLQVDALEKQIKAKKQFIEELSAERDQEHEDYQKELAHWKQLVQEREKQEGVESRLQREIDDLTEQLQSRVDLHNQALLATEKYQREARDSELSVKELKSIIHQLEQEMQEKVQEMEQDKQKLAKLEEELSKRPYPDEELSDSGKSDGAGQMKTESPDYLGSMTGQERRMTSPYTVEEELRQAADKTKEELVRERNTLQIQLEEQMKQMSALRNQLDEIRQRTDFTDPAQSARRLEIEREKSEEKDKEISELKLRIENLSATVESRDQQLEQLTARERKSRSPVEGEDTMTPADRRLDRQLQILEQQNASLKRDLEMATGLTKVSDVSGLSQRLLEEKNEEIDNLTEQIQRLQTERGVQDLYDEMDSLREELKQKEKEIMEIQNVRVSQTFTDHSITPEASMINVGASFTEKASILQEMEESEQENELQALKDVIKEREEQIVSLKVLVEETEAKAPETSASDVTVLQELITEKEDMVTQLTEQIDSLQGEVDNLTDFQTKLQEDFDVVQMMLEEKDREIETLTKELTDKSPESTGEDHALVIKHEVEISRLKKALREKDNVVEEKLEELAELADKLEQYEQDAARYRSEIQEQKSAVLEKDQELALLKKQVDAALMIKPPPIPITEDEKDELINQKQEEIIKLTRQLQEAEAGRPSVTQDSDDERSQVIKQKEEEIERLKEHLESALQARPPSPQRSEDEKSEMIRKQEKEIGKLKKQVEEALMIKPPPPPPSEDEKDRMINSREEEIIQLKKELERTREALSTGQQGSLLLEKVETLELQAELATVREQLDADLSATQSLDHAEEMMAKDKTLQQKDEELKKALEELQSVKEVKAYEAEMELQQKDEEIQQLQEELDSLRDTASLDPDSSGRSSDTKQLERRMSFYAEQYEEKCAEARQLQVSLDLAREQLAKLRAASGEEDMDVFDLATEKKPDNAAKELEERVEAEQERKNETIASLRKQLAETRERMNLTRDETVQQLEAELERARDEVVRERKDNIQTINDMEKLRDKKEKERKDSLKTAQSLEREIEAKEDREKELLKQIKSLKEEIAVLQGKVGLAKKSSEAEVIELERQINVQKVQAANVEELQEQIETALDDKEKYQSQVIRLEVDYKNLQQKMDEEVGRLEEQVTKLSSSQPDSDIWNQLHATQLRLEKTTEQLEQTSARLNETESSLKNTSAELSAREIEMKNVQDDLWKTSGEMTLTSTKLQETEEKLRQTVMLVTEREDQIHQLQGDLQHVQQEAEQATKKARAEAARTPSPQVDSLKQQLASTEAQLAEVKQSLKEAVEMSEQQLLMVEQKDQEYVKLKLEIQEMIAEKERTIREQKQKLQRRASDQDMQVSKVKGDMEKQVEKVRRESKAEMERALTEMEQLRRESDTAVERVRRESEDSVASQQRQMSQLREEAEEALASKDQAIASLQQQLAQRSTPDGAGGDSMATIGNLKAQIKEKEDVIRNLQLDLDQTRQDGESRRRSMHGQLTQLQQELTNTQSALQTRDTELSEVRGQSAQGEGQAPSPQESRSDVGISEDADRHIQQLRRELLIARTALIQIQKGSGWDQQGSPEELDTDTLVQEVMSQPQEAQQQQMLPSRQEGEAQAGFERMPDLKDVPRLQAELRKALEELELYRNSSNLSARDFVQKVMDLKEELSSEHHRHIQDISVRSQQEAEAQLAQLRIKLEDEIEHLRRIHVKDVEQKLNDLERRLERKHKGEMNKLVLQHQEEVEVLKTRAVPEFGTDAMQRLQDGILTADRLERGARFSQREDGVGQDHSRTLVNGVQSDPISSKLQALLRRLHNEGVQVLSISELEYLNRNLSHGEGPAREEADVASLRAGWENERQSLLSSIQSLKDLLAQTHKLRGLDRDEDLEEDDFDWLTNVEGSDWRAELLRAIGYVFSKEREALLAELRSHVLSHPGADISEVQRLEQKLRNQEAHQAAAMDQVFSADRQSMLAEIRDLRAHATIARMHHQEERERLSERIANTEDQASKKERQMKRQVQLLEFKIQQEKVLQEDLRSSLDSERLRNGDLAGQLNREKNQSLDLQTEITSLQVQNSKLKETLEREQSRFVSVTTALEEEKAKSLNLTELLESERGTLWRVQEELQTLKETNGSVDPRLIDRVQSELSDEHERRMNAESRTEVDEVTISNLRKEAELAERHHQDMTTEFQDKILQLKQTLDLEKQKCAELEGVIEREQTVHMRQAVDSKNAASDISTQDRLLIEDLERHLENERANVRSLNSALQREQRNVDSVAAAAESERAAVQKTLDKERQVNKQLKHDLEKTQFEKIELNRQCEREKEQVKRLKDERDQHSGELRKLRSVDLKRDRDREDERLTNKKVVREAERQKEEFKLKLHEQELESQRLTQKIRSLEDQLSEARDNEVHVVRELEEEKLRNMQTEAPREKGSTGAQSERRPEGADERRERWQVYRSQLESMCQSLHYLILRCREQLNRTSHSGHGVSDMADYDALQSSLRDLLSEVKQLQEMEGEFTSFPASSVNERVMRHNEELTNFVARISDEKTELRNTLAGLEEDIWQYREKDAKYQDLQRSSTATGNQLFAERAEWAKERLSLQMSLNAAEREVDQLQTDLRVERERRVAAGNTDATETDKVKIQRLYGKYLRAESFRKALIYQKKYLLLLLGGFQDTEQTTLALLARMGAQPALDRLHQHPQKQKPITSFRSAVRVVIAISRMRYMVKKWRRATRVGADVVAGSIDQSNGYVPQTNSYSPPRHSASPRYTSPSQRAASPSLSAYRRTISPLRLSDPSPYSTSSNIQLEVDTHLPPGYHSPSASGATASVRIHTTPPTKDYSRTAKYPSPSPSSGARRKILTSSSQGSQPSRVRFSSSIGNGDMDHDDYIHRLESLQNRLGTLQSGRGYQRKQPWK